MSTGVVVIQLYCASEPAFRLIEQPLIQKARSDGKGDSSQPYGFGRIAWHKSSSELVNSRSIRHLSQGTAHGNHPQVAQEAAKKKRPQPHAQ